MNPSVRRTTRQSLLARHLRKARDCANKVLRPLLRVLLAAGLSETQLIQLCERIIHELSKSDHSARFKSLPHHRPLEHIIGRWRNDPAYLEGGSPMRLGVKGKRPSFQSLVKSVAPKYSWSFALRALKQNRLVAEVAGNKIELISRFYPVRSNGAIDIQLFTTMTIDFLRAHEFNFLKNPVRGRGLFQRVAHKFNSDARLAPVFNRYVREEGQLFLETIDEWLVRHQPKRGGVRSKKRVRLGVGIYVINEALR